MKRRGFLGALLGAASLDPERLLWVPGAKVVSIPAPRAFVFIPVDLITPEAYARWVLELVRAAPTLIARDPGEVFITDWPRIGETLNAPRPLRFAGSRS